ncbi:hypothetical protein LXL04_023538 [Taraxacum kok-saghyz]
MKMRILVGIEVEDDQQQADEESSFAFMDDFNRNCTLSTKQSMLVFFNPIKFGIAFTFGNLLSLGRVLNRPKRQVNMMLDPVRIYATALYIASILLALLCALYVHKQLLTLHAIVSESIMLKHYPSLCSNIIHQVWKQLFQVHFVFKILNCRYNF